MASSESTYYLTVLPETDKFEKGIAEAGKRAGRNVTITPKIDISDGERRGGLLGRLIGRGAAAEMGRAGAESGREFEGRLSERLGARVGMAIGKTISAPIKVIMGRAGEEAGEEFERKARQHSTKGAKATGSSAGMLMGAGLLGALSPATLGVGALIGGVGVAASKGWDRLTAIDDAKFKLQGLGNSAEQTQKIMDSALAAVQGTSFGLDAAATTAASAVAAGIKPGEELTKYLTLTADAAAIAGTGLDDMGHIFNKVQTSNKAFTDDLNMLGDRGIPIFKWLQDEYHTTAEGLAKMVEGGKVDAATFQRAVAEHISGAAQKMGNSTSGAMQNFGAAVSRFGAVLVRPFFEQSGGLFGAMTKGLDSLGTTLSPIMQKVGTAVSGFMSSTVQPALGKVIGLIGSVGAEVGPVISRLFSEFGPKVKQFFADMAPKAREVFDMLKEAAPVVGKALAGIWEKVGPALANLLPSLKNAGGTVVGIFKNIIPVVKTIVPVIGTVIGGVVTAIGKVLPYVINAVSWIAGIAGKILSFVGPVFNAIVTGFKWLWDGAKAAWDVGKTIFDAIAAAVMWVWHNVLEPAFSAIGAIFHGVWAALQVGWAVGEIVFKAIELAVMWLWHSVFEPAFSAIGAVVSSVWTGVLSPVWEAFKSALQVVGEAMTWLWHTVFEPAWEGIKTAVQAVWDFMQPIFDKIGGAFTTVGSTVKDVAKSIGDALRTAFNGVVNVLKAPLHALGSFLQGIPDEVLGVKIPYVGTMRQWGNNLAGLRDGGHVNGPGTGTSDSILGFPAMVRVANGEFVTNAAATAKNGPLLQAINAGVPMWDMLRALPRFAGGGFVSQNDLIRFAQGVEGQPYKWGGVNWGDCSGAVSALANYATGRDPFGSRFATASEGTELAARGFQPGMGPAGSLSIGWYNGGPGGGHTAATLPDGTHFEMGGARGNGQFGGSAAGAGDSQFTNKMHLPPEFFTGLDGGAPTYGGGSSGSFGSSGGGGGGSYRAATSSELASSSNKVDSARTSARNADQSVSDAEYRKKRAYDRLAEAQAKGKGVEDAQHSADVADRELNDAKERQAKAHQKAADAENADNELRTKGKLDKSRSGKSGERGGLNGSDFGKTFFSGVLESIGLDGSVFSNPFEWPMVKSLMAGVNWAGGLLSGGGGDQSTAVGSSGPAGGGGGFDVGGFASGIAESVGVGDMLKPGAFNPAVSGDPAMAAGAAPDPSVAPLNVSQPQAPAGPIDNSLNLNGNFGYNKDQMMGSMRNEQNARTRTTTTN